MVNFKLSETNVKITWSACCKHWESCRGLRFFLCPTLVTCWSYYFHICFTELKIYHLSFPSPPIATSTSLILAVCRTHVKYEPSVWPCSPCVLCSSGVPAWVWEVIGSNPADHSDFFLVSCSWHTDHIIFTILLLLCCCSLLYFQYLFSWLKVKITFEPWIRQDYF